MAIDPGYILVNLMVLTTIQPSSAHQFRPNCTAPGQDENLVFSSNIRGTFDIMWSSLFTLLICTWTVQHLNVPAQGSANGSKLRAVISSTWRRMKWMLLTLVMPEFLVGKALQDNARAKSRCLALWSSQTTPDSFGRQHTAFMLIWEAFY